MHIHLTFMEYVCEIHWKENPLKRHEVTLKFSGIITEVH
jgi:hypothetical protein